MKYTSEEALSEIICRSERIAVRKAKSACRMLTGLTGALAAALVLVIAALPDKFGLSTANTVYGAFLLSPEGGGYVLTALIAFVLGVAIALLCRRYMDRHIDRGTDRKKD